MHQSKTAVGRRDMIIQVVIPNRREVTPSLVFGRWAPSPGSLALRIFPLPNLDSSTARWRRLAQSFVVPNSRGGTAFDAGAQRRLELLDDAITVQAE
jgi:hypothetical protein